MLTRSLGLLEVVGLCIGVMIGGTIYAALGVVNLESGGRGEAAFVLAALVAGLVGYIYAELGSRRPDSGGSYTIVAASLGTSAALLTAALQLLAYVASAGFYAWALSEYLAVTGVPSSQLTIVIPLAVVTTVVAFGARETGLLTVALAAVKVTVLAGVGLLALIIFHPSPPDLSFDVDLLRCAALVFLGFEGSEVAASAGVEMKNPRKDVKLAIFASLAVITAIYILLAAAARAANVPKHYATRALAFVALKLAEMPGSQQ